jgi:hypothetical protein
MTGWAGVHTGAGGIEVGVVGGTQPPAAAVEDPLVSGRDVVGGEVEVHLLGCAVGPLGRRVVRGLLDRDHGQTVGLQEVMGGRAGDRTAEQVRQNELSFSRSAASTMSDSRLKAMGLSVLEWRVWVSDGGDDSAVDPELGAGVGTVD